MAQYTVSEALQELDEMKARLSARVDHFLQNKDARCVAHALLALENEIVETEIEARRLRLTGELDLKVYKTLVEGYSQLSNYIIKRSSEQGLDGEVKNFYTFLRFENFRARNQASS